MAKLQALPCYYCILTLPHNFKTQLFSVAGTNQSQPVINLSFQRKLFTINVLIQESAKRGLRTSDSEAAACHCWTMLHSLDVGLRALAPFMPRLSQHLHERLPHHPFYNKHYDFPQVPILKGHCAPFYPFVALCRNT